MNPSLKKRFWADATVTEVGGGFEVLLDERQLKTPARTPLIVPTRALAQMIADEWAAQEAQVDPKTMPMTRRVNAALDKVAPQRAEVAAMLSAYGGSDLLCYRSAYPAELAARQAKAWDPLLDWAGEKFSFRLQVTNGIMHHAQAPEALEKLTAEVNRLDIFPLTGFHDLVTHSGSLVIALAAIHGYGEIGQLWQHSQIDEIWQVEQWGADEEAEATAISKRQDFCDAFRFFQVVSG
ncbi:MAG: ATPase [Alphaproteobacteria bacterium]|nr:ATPase [Alphaproteobacteria bacterium]